MKIRKLVKKKKKRRRKKKWLMKIIRGKQNSHPWISKGIKKRDFNLLDETIYSVVLFKIDAFFILLKEELPFHLITYSLNKNLDDLEYPLKSTNQKFDVITISESRLASNMNDPTNVNLPNYSIEYIQTKCHNTNKVS